MYGAYSNQNMIDRLSKEKERIDNMIQNYQQMSQQPVNPINPVNNYINTNQNISNNMYELKKLNDNQEVEDILVDKDTVLLGGNKLQIKKMDGTIEKYNIERYYPVDEKDKIINKLDKHLEEQDKQYELILKKLEKLEKGYNNDK